MFLIILRDHFLKTQKLQHQISESTPNFLNVENECFAVLKI